MGIVDVYSHESTECAGKVILLLEHLSLYIATKALNMMARYYYVRGLSLLKQEGMDGGCGPVSYIIVPPDLN